MDPNATVMWGARIAPEMNGKIQVITIITGVKSPYILGKTGAGKFAAQKHKANELGIEVIV